MNNKLYKKIFSELKKILLSMSKKNQDKFSHRLKDEILSRGHKYTRSIGRVSEKEKKLINIFRPIGEIFTSLDSLEKIPILIKNFPNSSSFKKHKISRIWYLRYHVENHLNEVYILQQRCNALINQLKKLLKKRKNKRRHFILLESYRKRFNNSLEGLKNTRGRHIHKARYSDQKIERVEMLELMLDEKIFPGGKIYKDIEYKVVRKEWYEITSKNFKSLKKLVNALCGTLYPVVFGTIFKK